MADERPTAEDNINFLLGIWRESTFCEACSEGAEVWSPEDELDNYYHGEDDDVSECEDSHIEELVKRGLVPRHVWKKALCGHQWYGENYCPECRDREEVE